MHSRPPNSSDGSTAVTASEASGGDLPPVGATGAQTSRLNRGSTGGGEPDSPSWCRTPKSFDVFQSRTIFRFPRRSSSGYFSSDCDSLPSSPLSPKPVMSDKAVQTPSLTGQVLIHALQRMGEVRGEEPGTQHDPSPSPSRTWQQNAAGDMQAETFGQQLRRIGDEYNRLLLQRRAPRPVVLLPNIVPHIHQEPVTLICVGLLLILIGRWIWIQGNTNTQDTQV
ncbi:bcl-2-like protein 11 [Pelmatolapia mariae]|uniref:bcl-2-like protein 11 n=1 Tax=Pelmatolapia mariae TaxID=158779 RepID=UPI002FE5F97F